LRLFLHRDFSFHWPIYNYITNYLNQLRYGEADIGKQYLDTIREAAKEYANGIMRRLREHEYNPELMKLYVVGGGGCLIENFTDYDPARVTVNTDICATAKGYELLASGKLGQKGGS